MMDLKQFMGKASPFEIVLEPGDDPRQILYARYQKGEEQVLEPLLQAHLMVPREKTVVPEVLRLAAKAPKDLNNLYRIALTMGDRGDDFQRALVFGQKFLEVYKRHDKPRELMEKMVAYWKNQPVDTTTEAFRLAHGDVACMLEAAGKADDPWLKDMWLMHAAANGSQEAFAVLAEEQMQKGNTVLALRLEHNIPGSKRFIQQELEVLVFELHAYEAAERIAWSLEDDSLSRWLRLIHYAQGTNHDIEGIEDLVDRLGSANVMN